MCTILRPTPFEQSVGPPYMFRFVRVVSYSSYIKLQLKKLMVFSNWKYYIRNKCILESDKYTFQKHVNAFFSWTGLQLLSLLEGTDHRETLESDPSALDLIYPSHSLLGMKMTISSCYFGVFPPSVLVTFSI